MVKLSVIIPNYNSSKWINQCIDSVLNQMYSNFELIIVDDMSTDDSVEKIKQYVDPRIKLIELDKKRFNGGSRNVGVEYSDGDYILFLDCDDYFYNVFVFKKIVDVIEKTNADLIRLPYRAKTQKGGFTVRLKENNPKDLVNSVFCAPWTKCIKRDLFVPFPENTLLEDVVQHIAQVDVINSIGLVDTPVVVWNRTNENAISSEVKTYTRDDKRYSSVYRNVADLLDLRCKHDYCEEHRQFRLNNYIDIVQRGDILGLINGVKTR